MLRHEKSPFAGIVPQDTKNMLFSRMLKLRLKTPMCYNMFCVFELFMISHKQSLYHHKTDIDQFHNKYCNHVCRPLNLK